MDNNERFMNLLEEVMPEFGVIMQLMNEADVQPEDMMRALYLIANIKRVTKWGKVTILIQDGKIVRVNEEQGFKSE